MLFLIYFFLQNMGYPTSQTQSNLHLSSRTNNGLTFGCLQTLKDKNQTFQRSPKSFAFNFKGTRSETGPVNFLPTIA